MSHFSKEFTRDSLIPNLLMYLFILKFCALLGSSLIANRFFINFMYPKISPSLVLYYSGNSAEKFPKLAPNAMIKEAKINKSFPQLYRIIAAYTALAILTSPILGKSKI